MNYEVGDEVQILSPKHLIKASNGYNSQGDLKFGTVVFVDNMKKNCNKKGIIKEVVIFEDDQSKIIFYEIKFNDQEYLSKYVYTSEMFNEDKQVLPKRENRFDEELL